MENVQEKRILTAGNANPSADKQRAYEDNRFFQFAIKINLNFIGGTYPE